MATEMKIIDNINDKINDTFRDDLKAIINTNSKIAIAASHFSISAFQELNNLLRDIDEV